MKRAKYRIPGNVRSQQEELQYSYITYPIGKTAECPLNGYVSASSTTLSLVCLNA